MIQPASSTPPAPPEPTPDPPTPLPVPATPGRRMWLAIRGIPTEALGHERAMHAMWGIGTSALIAFAMANSILPYGDGLNLASIGMLMGLAVLAFHSVYVQEGMGRYLWLSVALTFGLLAAAWLIEETWTIADNVRANDARCADIQRDMLAAEPKREDGPALFQALGCSPQGEQSVAFPAAAPSRTAPAASHAATPPAPRPAV